MADNHDWQDGDRQCNVVKSPRKSAFATLFRGDLIVEWKKIFIFAAK